MSIISSFVCVCAFFHGIIPFLYLFICIPFVLFLFIDMCVLNSQCEWVCVWATVLFLCTFIHLVITTTNKQMNVNESESVFTRWKSQFFSIFWWIFRSRKKGCNTHTTTSIIIKFSILIWYHCLFIVNSIVFKRERCYKMMLTLHIFIEFSVYTFLKIVFVFQFINKCASVFFIPEFFCNEFFFTFAFAQLNPIHRYDLHQQNFYFFLSLSTTISQHYTVSSFSFE